MKDFWNKWKKRTQLEDQAIESLKTAKSLVLSKISKTKIIAIYTGGSFVRREMNRKSDVDTWTIVKDDESLKQLKYLYDHHTKDTNPEVGLSGYSLEELKSGNLSSSGKSPRPSPPRFLKMMPNYEIIYGKALNRKEFLMNSDKEDLRELIKLFEGVFFPQYKDGRFGFSQLIKQVFLLVGLEQSIKGKKVPYSWIKLAKSVKDKNHIVHDTLNLRLNPTKDKEIREKFIIRLKSYLNKLELLLK